MQLTKQIIQEHLGDYLIKVAEKKEYIDDLLAGNLYMKESGYFRKLEDGYRGDVNRYWRCGSLFRKPGDWGKNIS